MLWTPMNFTVVMKNKNWNNITFLLIFANFSVLSWTSVLDYLKNLKKSSCDAETQILCPNPGEIKCPLFQPDIPADTGKLEDAPTKEVLHKNGALCEIQLTTLNLKETLV